MNLQYFRQLDEQLYMQKLSNGLTLMVVPRRGFQKKLAYFVTDYGSIHSSFTVDGEKLVTPAGIAHYLEHKMFDMPRGEISGEFAQLGANPNAFTGYDMTAYYFSCTENFEKCLSLLLEFVSTPWFTDESVAKEQGIIAQEIDMVADSPDTVVYENLMRAMYHRHPIRTPILGNRDSIAQITPQVLHQCHKAFYRPDNMILCVVGDVDADQIKAMAQTLPPVEGTVEKILPPQEPMTCVQPRIECRMEISMPTFQLGFKCEPAGKGEAGIRQEIIGDLAAEALFGEASRLYLELYEKGLIDSSFGGGFETAEGMSMLTASGDSTDPDAIRAAVLAYAEELVRTGVEEKDFQRMKRSSLGRRIRDLDSFDSVCFRLCAYRLSDFEYFRFPAVYDTVDAEAVRVFLQQVVTPERCSMSVITPIEQEV